MSIYYSCIGGVNGREKRDTHQVLHKASMVWLTSNSRSGPHYEEHDGYREIDKSNVRVGVLVNTEYRY